MARIPPAQSTRPSDPVGLLWAEKLRIGHFRLLERTEKLEASNKTLLEDMARAEASSSSCREQISKLETSNTALLARLSNLEAALSATQAATTLSSKAMEGRISSVKNRVEQQQRDKEKDRGALDMLRTELIRLQTGFVRVNETTADLEIAEQNTLKRIEDLESRTQHEVMRRIEATNARATEQLNATNKLEEMRVRINKSTSECTTLRQRMRDLEQLVDEHGKQLQAARNRRPQNNAIQAVKVPSEAQQPSDLAAARSTDSLLQQSSSLKSTENAPSSPPFAKTPLETQ
jgi:chromosome segregation ATPase